MNKDDYIRYFVNTPVPSVNYCDGLMDLIVVFALFVFMLALLCFCVATIFSVNKDLYISLLIEWIDTQPYFSGKKF